MRMLQYSSAHRLKCASLVTLAMLALCLSSAQAAAPFRGPGQTTPQIGGPGSGGESTSPGDAFLPQTDTTPQIGDPSPSAKGARAPYPCTVYLNEEGKPYMKFGNDTTIDYPVGTKLIITFSNGTVDWTEFTLHPFKAGTEWNMSLPYAYVPPLECSIEVEPPEEDVPH